MLYNIAGLWVDFIGDNEYFEERTMSFRRDYSEKPQECDMLVSMKLRDFIQKPVGEEILGGKEAVILRKNPPEEGYYIYNNDFEMNMGERKNASLIDINKNWNDITLEFEDNDKVYASRDNGELINWNQFSSFLSIGIAFRNLLVKKDGLQIHCSSIEYEGKGYIFSAPSGTGKSTHVRLWRELYGDKVTIINEDRPAIRYIDNKPMLCGTPWSGTSNNFANRIVPLNYIVLLEQAPFNRIERLEGFQAMQMVMPRCFLPYFDQDLMNEAFVTLERLLKDVPVYLLKCLPDYDAVELVRKYLK
jgi:hypothetical protein